MSLLSATCARGSLPFVNLSTNGPSLAVLSPLHVASADIDIKTVEP